MCCQQLQVTLEATGKKDCFSAGTVAHEHGKKFTLRNPAHKTVCRVKVDDCLIDAPDTRKCDYLFKVCEMEKYFLVELKGQDVSTAVTQIVRTYDIVNRKIKVTADRYKGVIVSSAVPSATQQHFRKLQDKYYREKQLLITKTHFHHVEAI
jgi:hypothetical protein